MTRKEDQSLFHMVRLILPHLSLQQPAYLKLGMLHISLDKNEKSWISTEEDGLLHQPTTFTASLASSMVSEIRRDRTDWQLYDRNSVARISNGFANINDPPGRA